MRPLQGDPLLVGSVGWAGRAAAWSAGQWGPRRLCGRAGLGRAGPRPAPHRISPPPSRCLVSVRVGDRLRSASPGLRGCAVAASFPVPARVWPLVSRWGAGRGPGDLSPHHGTPFPLRSGFPPAVLLPVRRAGLSGCFACSVGLGDRPLTERSVSRRTRSPQASAPLSPGLSAGPVRVGHGVAALLASAWGSYEDTCRKRPSAAFCVWA